MKNKILAIVLTLGLCACVANNPQVNNHGVSKPCCGIPSTNCCSTSYTVEEPVKVIYKKTTVHRVYVPKTYTETTYEERPYCYQNMCK